MSWRGGTDASWRQCSTEHLPCLDEQAVEGYLPRVVGQVQAVVRCVPRLSEGRRPVAGHAFTHRLHQLSADSLRIHLVAGLRPQVHDVGCHRQPERRREEVGRRPNLGSKIVHQLERQGVGLLLGRAIGIRTACSLADEAVDTGAHHGRRLGEREAGEVGQSTAHQPFLLARVGDGRSYGLQSLADEARDAIQVGLHGGVFAGGNGTDSVRPGQRSATQGRSPCRRRWAIT